MRPRPGIGDLRAAVRAAGDRLDAEAGGLPRVVVVITDFNTSMVRPDIGPIDAPSGVDLRLIHVPERPGNAYIQSVALSPRDRLTVNQKLRLTCRVGGGTILVNSRVNLTLNGEPAGTRSVHEVDAAGNALVTFVPPMPGTGQLAGSVELEYRDGLDIDNVWYFTCEVRKPPRLLCIGNPGSALQQRDIIAMALAPRGWHGRQQFDVRQVHHRSVPEQPDLLQYDCVILTGKCELSPDFWIRLQQYVNDGGSLLVYPDSTTSLSALNGGGLPLLPDEIRLAPVDGKPQSLRPAGTAMLGTELLRQAGRRLARQQFQRFYYCMPPTDDTALQPILRFSDGSLAAATRHIGRGASTFFGLATHTDWSDFLHNDAFAPTLQSLVQPLVRLDDAGRDTMCYAPVTIEHPGRTVSDAVVRMPGKSGVVRLAAADFHGARATFQNTSVPGHYRVDFENSEETAVFAVNLFRSDRHYRFVPVADRSAVAGTGASVHAAGEEVVLSTNTVATDLPITPFCLLLVFLLLLAEAFFGNRHLLPKSLTPDTAAGERQRGAMKSESFLSRKPET